VARKYGAYREDGGFANRDLFIVDKEGRIAYIDRHELLDQPNNEELFDVLKKL
jgi:alkyl hydroperoxide reductase subunit AhpC